MEKNQTRPRILLILSVAIAIVCALAIPKVNVNSDMTKYLPDKSQMKQGMDILSSEFGQSASSAIPDVRIMMASADSGRMKAVGDSISRMPGVDAIRTTSGNGHTLFELTVSKSVNQKRLASSIVKAFPEYGTISQTSQDGNTPAPGALVFAVIALVIILLVMSSSYMEPVLFLAATGMAVAVNMGTNALLGSVSITTHSIAAVLQLALSMDYSIILMNRYRHELECAEDRYSAMEVTLKKAAPAILSSSFTTMVGLLMLVFMNIKIGKDLGFVLAKGVLCSLVYTYTALPGLILLCHNAIMASGKKIPIRGTGRMAAFCEKFRIPVTVLFVLLFGAAYCLSTHTPMKFSSATPTEIDKVFPKKNAIVVLYPNGQEKQTAAMLEKTAQDPHVESIFSYPTLMKKELGAEEMVSFLKEQAAQAGNGQAEMLTPELMRMCYYAKFGNPDIKVGFTELVDFITSLEGSPLMEKVDIPDLSGKLEMLDAIRAMSSEQSYTPSGGNQRGPHGPVAGQDEQDGMTVHDYMTRLQRQQDSQLTRELLRLSDPVKLATKMSVEQMTAFMGSTAAQTRMVYSFSNNSKSGMTPVEFGHFLTDDLFNRKGLAKMVSKDQKAGMILRVKIMDAAAAGAILSRSELDRMAAAYGVKQVLKDEPAAPAAEAGYSAVEAVSEPAEDAVRTPVEGTQNMTVAEPAAEEAAPEVQEDPRIVLLGRMLEPGRKYDYRHMARNFRALGENVDDFTVSMLYTLYGSEKCYDPEWKMDLESFVGFIKDFISDERLAPYIGEDIGAGLGEMESALKDGVAQLKGPEHSIAAIITDYPDEAPETEAFIRSLEGEHFLIGESVMLTEMKDGFRREQRLVTILTILAIFSIVALTFRSLLIAAILVMTVMTAVFINVASCGVGGGSMFYLSYLIVQSILMGATIDYGILMTTCYREHRDLKEAYHGSIRTILTSGLIMCCVPGAMALLLDDAMIQPIVKNLAIGSFSALVIVLLVLPGVLSLVIGRKK